MRTNSKNFINFRMSIVFYLLFSLLLNGCQTDYDIEEIAPPEFLEANDHAHHEQANEETSGEEYETTDEHEANSEDVNEQLESSHAGHSHGAGERNHGTQWFFNQPWAAPFIWGKLLRDSFVFLGIAVFLFIITSRKGKK